MAVVKIASLVTDLINFLSYCPFLFLMPLGLTLKLASSMEFCTGFSRCVRTYMCPNEIAVDK